MKSIFVSSTFKDMQSERNLIKFKVTPEINKFLNEYEETIDFTDLRWGIDTTQYLESSLEKMQEGEEKVLRICLEEIHKTPYFIVILGERYGWVPENPKMIKHVIDVLDKEKEIDYYLSDNNISVTNLEIDYGAFYRKHPENCLFYFRELQSSKKSKWIDIYKAHDKNELDRIEGLKEKIRQQFPEQVKTYTAQIDENTGEITEIDNLANMIIEDVKKIIQRDLKKVETKYWQEKEEHEINCIINKKTEKFTGQKRILEEIDNFINNQYEEKDVLFIVGDAGTGKSALISKISKIYKESCNTIPFFIDNTENSKNEFDILKYQLYKIYKLLNLNENKMRDFLENNNVLFEPVYNEEINKIIGINRFEYHEVITKKILKETISIILNIYSKISNKKFIFLVDAVDQLELEKNEEALEWIIDREISNVKYIVTCLKGSELANQALNRIKNIELLPLTIEDVKDIFKYYNKHSTIELNEAVINQILQKEQITNFLYLSLVIQRFKMFGKYDFDMIKKLGNDMKAINAHLIDVSKYFPDTIEYMCIRIMEYANQIYNKDILKNILGLIATSKNGLREQDLEAIYEDNNIEWHENEFKTILNFLSDYFIIKDDGRIDLSHRIFKEVISKEYEGQFFANTNQTFKETLLEFMIKNNFNNDESLYLTDIIFLLWDRKCNPIIILTLILGATNSEDKEEKRIIAKELWKYFKKTPEWIFNIQDYYSKNFMKYDSKIVFRKYTLEINLELFEYIQIYFSFWFDTMYEYISENALEKKLFMDLLRWWNERRLEENIYSEIKDSLEPFTKTLWAYILEISDNVNEVYSILEEYCKTEKLNIEQKMNAIKIVTILDNKWFSKRLELIDEMLNNDIIKSEDNIYDELIKYKAETYYFKYDYEEFSKILFLNGIRYRERLNTKDGRFEDGKKYVEMIQCAYTKLGNYIFSESSEDDLILLTDLINDSKEILEWTKLQYKSKNNKISILELAKAYELVARQYNTLIYKNGKLLPYDTENSNKYIKILIELLKDRKEYADYLIEIIDYEIEMFELEEQKDVEINFDKNEIQINYKKAKETLKYEDIIKYTESIPVLPPIYEKDKCDVKLDELMPIYEQFENFYQQDYNDEVYNNFEKYNLDINICKIRESKITALIIKNGLRDIYINDIINIFYMKLNWHIKIFEYKNYQYYYEKNYEKRKEIIYSLEHFTNQCNKLFETDNFSKQQKELLSIRKKAYTLMAEDESLELIENEEEKAELKNILNQLLLKEII